MRIGFLAASCGCVLATLACGGTSTSPHQDTGVATDASIAQYGDLTSRVQAAAVAYGEAMAAPAMTTEGCAAAHYAYDAKVRPWISQMVQAAGSMDAFMDAHGGSGYADMACVANAMMQELDAHRLVACTYPTLGGDQTEAARHAAVMASYTGHASDRCGQMAGGQYMWGPTAPVCGGTTGGSPAAPLALGERIFDTGVGVNGQAIVRTGGAGMMMASGCASCHGYDGLGRTTMMFTAPNITYANLTDPAGLVDPDGSRGPTYTDDQLRRAITQGLDADGSTLSTTMPRWQLSDDDWSALLTFLKSLPPAPSTGGGTTTPPPGSGTITGTVFLGRMQSGTVAAYGVSGGMMATLLGTSSVDASGNFTMPIGSYAGTVMLRMTGGTFVDEATGATMTMQGGDALSSCIPSIAAGATTSGVHVTPLTSMAQGRAQGMAGGMTAANALAANASVGDYFGAGDILMTFPMDPSVAGAGSTSGATARNHGMAIAAMSQYAKSIGMTVSSSGMFTAMTRDASDGVMNGMMGSTSIAMGGMSGGGGMMGGGMGGYTMPATAGTSGLATAMAAFVGSSRNGSGVSMSEMQPLVDKLAASNGTIQ